VHHGFEFMKPVGPSAQDIEQQVNFAGGLRYELHRRWVLAGSDWRYKNRWLRQVSLAGAAVTTSTQARI
jgi:hypothetical protein